MKYSSAKRHEVTMNGIQNIHRSPPVASDEFATRQFRSGVTKNQRSILLYKLVT
jgi:hypothetical protein